MNKKMYLTMKCLAVMAAVGITGVICSGAEVQKNAQKTDLSHPEVVIDLDKRSGEINKYIYGQFIEHLGRCIYGGIWAEMLEDRKFYYYPGMPDSPWRRIGGEVGWSLTSDVKRPYASEISVRISVTDRADTTLHGIRQDGLGLLKGHKYEGHVVVAGKGELEVKLAWGDDEGESQTVVIPVGSRKFVNVPIEFSAAGSTAEGVIEVGLRNPGRVWIGTLSLMPSDNINGMRADTLKLLKELDSPIYRWPGGNFVSGYDWRDGIGARDKRPPRKNPAWQGVEHNDFGIDEFITFCREIDTEPLVVVNTGLGSPELAAALVEYCNGGADTKWGRRRAENGHPEPYNVEYWGVGNEMYGGWQLGNVPLDNYTIRHNEYSKAMLDVDSDIKLVGVGASGRWSELMLRNCSEYMDLLSEHFYCQEKDDLEAHVWQIRDSVRGKAETHKRYLETIPQLEEKPIPIALDEWNFWYGPYLYGELGVRYFLKDALGIAGGIHEMARNNEIFEMANYAQTVNVIGCIKTSTTNAFFATTGLPLKLYRHHFGNIALDVEGAPMPLDVAAALDEDGGKLTVGIVNPTRGTPVLRIALRNCDISGSAVKYVITADDPMAFNDAENQPVKIRKSQVKKFDPAAIAIDPISITLYVIELQD